VLASDSFVLDGLGEIDDPRATRRLLRALRTDDSLIRVHAVMALGRHSRSLAVAALAAALSDREYLVRYHALRGLAAMGDASALPALAAFDRDTEVEGELAAQATAAIRGRTTGADTLRIP
jgi:HEAT repeat protein